MFALWGTFLLCIAFMSTIKLIMGSEYMNMVALLCVCLHIPMVLGAIMLGYREYAKIICLGYLLRVFVMIWDIFGRSIYIIPHAGTDDYGYLIGAIDIGNNISLITERIYGGVYSKTVGMLLYFSGGGDIIVRYLNVLLSVTVVLLIYKCLTLLGITGKTKKISMWIISIFPQALIFSGLTLRESLITFVVTISFYFFVKWHKFGGALNAVVSIAFICLASVYHAGCIFILLGYMFAQLFYKPETEKFAFRTRTVVLFSLFLILMMSIYSQWSDIFLAKFPEYDEGVMFNRASYATGSSAYLSGMQIDNMSKFIMFTPLKMIYFLIAPVPWDWRGLMDATTFFMDSLFYLVTVYLVIKNFKNIMRRQKIILGLMIAIIASIFIFGIGSGNSGTAVRHRHKLMPMFVIALACALQQKEYDKDCRKEKDKKNVGRCSD